MLRLPGRVCGARAASARSAGSLAPVPLAHPTPLRLPPHSQASLLSERLNGCGIVQQLEIGHPHLEPVLLGIAGILGVAALWPAKAQAAGPAEMARQLAGRLAFGGLAAALAVEVWTGKGLLAILEFDVGAEALSESEAVLAALMLLVLTKPKSGK